jgi:hypothetical protein
MARQIPLKAYTDTYTYSLFLLSIVKHRSSWSSSFICGCNANGFMKENQRVSLYWHSRRFSEGPNRRYYDLVRDTNQAIGTIDTVKASVEDKKKIHQICHPRYCFIHSGYLSYSKTI